MVYVHQKQVPILIILVTYSHGLFCEFEKDKIRISHGALAHFLDIPSTNSIANVC